MRIAGRLAWYFGRNGYVRWQQPPDAASAAEARPKDHKGDEVRFVADSEQELLEIRRLLVRAGFRPGRPWVKGRQLRQPVYGRDAVRDLLAMMLAAPAESIRRGTPAKPA